MAAQVHDIGKARIPLELLTKPGRITSDEYGVLKTHVQFGYEILNKISFPFNLAEIVWCHHEYLDGSGYPRGIGGDALPLEARILTVADIVESMSADRPYRKSLGMAVALEEIQRQSGSRLDPWWWMPVCTWCSSTTGGRSPTSPRQRPCCIGYTGTTHNKTAGDALRRPRHAAHAPSPFILRHPILTALALSLGTAVALGVARFSYALLLAPMRSDLGWPYPSPAA
jgi:hypothetical protein